jgi:hypothetical protein
MVVRMVMRVPVSVGMCVAMPVPRTRFRMPACASPAHVPVIMKPLRHRHGEQVARQKNEGGKFPRKEHDRDSAQQIALE